jgi:hypothetical protein
MAADIANAVGVTIPGSPGNSAFHKVLIGNDR